MSGAPPTLVRYWGSYFKSPDQVQRVAGYFSSVLAAGWRCHLVCCQPPADQSWVENLVASGIQLHYLPRARGNFDWRCVMRTWRLCRDTDADVLHCDNTHTSPLLGAWLARVQVRLWTKHAMQPAFEQGRRPTARDRLAPAVRTSAWAATRVLPISRAIGDELRLLGLPSRKLLVMPLPVAAGSSPPDRDGARARFGYGRDDLVFGTVGRAIPVKGWDRLLQAFADVRERQPRARLLLVGSTASEEERACRVGLDAIVAARGLTAAVAWAGHLTDPSAAMRAMDVFVLPSRSEGFSLALVEALMMGLPVVSTRVGIAPDVIRDGHNGLLVERDDAAALGSALRRVTEDTGFRAALAAAAAAPLPGIPTPAAHAAALCELYESLLSRRRVRVAAASRS